MNTLKRLKCCVIIPCYDNAGTVRDVTERALNFCCDVIVVDDGSTDGPAAALQGLPAKVVRHDRNRGKGQALKTGFRIAASLGFERAITLDSDGQHYPEDIQAFAAALDTHPGSMLVGCRNLRHENMPGGNTFANRFSNFWFKASASTSYASLAPWLCSRAVMKPNWNCWYPNAGKVLTSRKSPFKSTIHPSPSASPTSAHSGTSCA